MRFLWAFVGFVFLLFAVGCSGGSSGTSSDAPASSVVVPMGAQVAGVTFVGRLAGKKMYLLPATMNPSHCWVDSQAWTGTELFFGISSINWTNLDQGTLNYDSLCSPQPAFSPQSSPGVTGNFNIYRAVVSGGSWVVTSLPINVGQTASLAAPKLSGNTLVFVKYEKTASKYGNIYLSQRSGDNSYSTPVAFGFNSTACNDDNPYIFANGTQMIFESSRADATATSCGSKQTLWSSSLNGTWSTPVALSGAPASATQSVTQPWLDSTQAGLYFTAAGSDCSGGVTTCVKMVSGSGTAWTGTPVQLITPTAVGTSWAGGGMLGLVGQYTEANGYAFVACGIVSDVDPSGSTSGLIFGRFRIDIQSCVIPL